jgi:hypothetical protein
MLSRVVATSSTGPRHEPEVGGAINETTEGRWGGDLGDEDIGSEEPLEVDGVRAVLHHDVRKTKRGKVKKESSEKSHRLPP